MAGLGQVSVYWRASPRRSWVLWESWVQLSRWHSFLWVCSETLLDSLLPSKFNPTLQYHRSMSTGVSILLHSQGWCHCYPIVGCWCSPFTPLTSLIKHLSRMEVGRRNKACPHPEEAFPLGYQDHVGAERCKAKFKCALSIGMQLPQISPKHVGFQPPL